jgi:hypothetical protein
VTTPDNELAPSAAWGPLPSLPPAPSSYPRSPAGAPSAPWAPPGAVGPAPYQSVNGFAVTSLVLGLFFWCGTIPGILAVIFGYVALGRIARSEGREKGRGLAIAGIVLGWISIALLAALAIAWLVYGLTNL